MRVSKDGLKIAGCVSKKQIRFGIWRPGDLETLEILSVGYLNLELE